MLCGSGWSVELEVQNLGKLVNSELIVSQVQVTCFISQPRVETDFNQDIDINRILLHTLCCTRADSFGLNNLI